MDKKPALSFWQIWNMCFGFLGIQFGFALQNANVSRIFQTLGADVEHIPLLWIAAPVTGLIVQPIIGYMSDKTWTSLGRRRPYFLIGAILTTFALVFMPNSPSLWIAAGTLWILDASINISMEPFRAFVGDNLPHKQRTLGFAMQSFFIGIGAIIASFLPYILFNYAGISNTAAAGEVPDSVRISFYLGAAVLFLAVGWTVLFSREYSPEQMASFEEEVEASQEVAAAHAGPRRSSAKYLRDSAILLVAGAALCLLIYSQGWDKQLYILAGGLLTFALLQLITWRMAMTNRTSNGLYEIVDDLFHMPKTMKQLAVVQFFSWFALFAMWIYATAGVAEYHFGSSDPTTRAFNDGADWVGVLFGSYNGFAALAAIIIPVIANRFGRRTSHLINLWCGGAGMISFIFIKDPQWLLLSMVGVGIAWASILSVPYAILSGALPAHKMGVYMGIFNFFIVIPQIMAASVIGLLVRVLFDGEAIYALVIGGVFLLIGGLVTLFVDDSHDPVVEEAKV
ncbi:SLC45 family MFS transporter [Pseudomaricurvus alcaniphilus]|uniref:MFS transporter n=1 Tax=Pseudomaricurvus alcaniphilus TaxID=1166482 RepID=UPI00140B47A7|nr:MFS transporter [Pseudomaricurvus alcaniphilus]NHN37363.1 SLC45 family MFS transporter [Pseudomaricurvus alcaniphilus]